MNFERPDHPLTVAIIGASGGIGGAFLTQLSDLSSVERIYAFSRKEPDTQSNNVIWKPMDITAESSVQEAVTRIEGGTTLDIIINAAGLLHDVNCQPEKSLKELDPKNFERIFAVNLIGPAMVFKYFLPLIPRDRPSVCATLSARVGSISDNQIGGWYGYRASKAALNMLIKCTAIEMARKYKQAVIVGLHPGTVDTSLSKPFQGHVPQGKLFTPEEAAQKMLNVIRELQPDQSGKLFAYDGMEIAP